MMENREKFIENAKAQADAMEGMVKNFSTFVDQLKGSMTKEEQDKLNKEMKSVNISDVSNTIKMVNEDLSNFQKKYNR